MTNKKKFKVDKLGYYETRGGDIKRITSLKGGEGDFPIVGTNGDTYTPEGLYWYNKSPCGWDLVKYLGAKKPATEKLRVCGLTKDWKPIPSCSTTAGTPVKKTDAELIAELLDLNKRSQVVENELKERGVETDIDYDYNYFTLKITIRKEQ